MPIGHSKAMWQREWHNLVANFGTKQCKWHDHDMTRWPNVESICNKSEMHTYSKEIQIWFQEILHIWSLEIQQHLSQDLAVRESRPCGHVSWFWFLPQEVRRVQAHSWLQVQVHDHWSTLLCQNDSIHHIHQAKIQSGEACVLTKEDMPSSF